MQATRPWFRCLILIAGILTAGMPARVACAEALIIPGSGNFERVLTVLADRFNGQQVLFQVSVPTSTGTAGAIRDVEAGTTTLGRVGRPLKPDELAGRLTYIPIGRDPVVFAGGAGVTVQGLTTEQIIDAFTGKVSNWGEFGGKPGPIRVIGREATDASRQAIDRVLPPFRAIVFGDDVKVVNLDPQMIELLDRFPGSLGYLNRSALGAVKTRIVYLSFDGIEPTAENVQTGRYQLWLEFGLIHKTGGLDTAAKAFVAFVRSPMGARILREQGVLVAADRSEPR